MIIIICTVCKTDYQLQQNNWRFEGCSSHGEAMYVVESEVFTPAILQGILNDATQNEYAEISVNAYLAEYTACTGCQRLNIQLNAAREAVLQLPPYEKITYYDSF